MERVDFNVKTIKDYPLSERFVLPEGSGIHVERELKKHYYGIWSSAMGSYHVKVPKDICVKLLDENVKQENYIEMLRQIDPEGCKRLEAHLAEAASRMY
jgi:hypothetical protein